MPSGAPGCGSLTTLVVELAPLDPQQRVGWWLYAISVAGVSFYVAGVVRCVAGVVFCVAGVRFCVAGMYPAWQACTLRF